MAPLFSFLLDLFMGTNVLVLTLNSNEEAGASKSNDKSIQAKEGLGSKQWCHCSLPATSQISDNSGSFIQKQHSLRFLHKV